MKDYDISCISLWRSSCASFTSFPLSFGDKTHKNPKVEKKTHEVTTNKKDHKQKV